MPDASTRVWLEVDETQLVKNVRTIAEVLEGASLCAVLKANAYGVGLEDMAALLAREPRVGRLAISTLHEGERIQSISRSMKPVLMLGPPLPREIAPALALRLELSLGDLPLATLVAAEARRRNCTARVHILVDTGMGRFGFHPEEGVDAIRETCGLDGIECVGISTHFPLATDLDFSLGQLGRFQVLLQRLAPLKFQLVHAANSQGVASVPASTRAPFTMARVGLGLFGLVRSQRLSVPIPLTLRSVVVAKRWLPFGQTVGYGRTHRMIPEGWMATVAGGYGDGLPIQIGHGKAVVKVVHEDEDELTETFGPIQSDFFMCRLLDDSNATVGDSVILAQGFGFMDWSQATRIHPWTLLTGLSARIGRRFVNRYSDFELQE